MAIDFPSNPTTGQKYTFNSIVYTWTGTTWTASANISQFSDPILTGAPTAPATIPPADNSTRVANTKFVRSEIAAAVAALPPPPTISLEITGTCICFHMQAPPPGWTRRTDLNDRALRCVSGGVSAGGVLAFSTVFGKTAVDNHTLDGNELTSHAHGVADPTHAHGIGDPGHAHTMQGVAGTWQAPQGYPGASYWTIDYTVGGTDGAGTGIWTGGAYASIGIYGAGASWGHNHGMDIRVLYVDVILATKD